MYFACAYCPKQAYRQLGKEGWAWPASPRPCLCSPKRSRPPWWASVHWVCMCCEPRRSPLSISRQPRISEDSNRLDGNYLTILQLLHFLAAAYIAGDLTGTEYLAPSIPSVQGMTQPSAGIITVLCKGGQGQTNWTLSKEDLGEGMFSLQQFIFPFTVHQKQAFCIHTQDK